MKRANRGEQALIAAVQDKINLSASVIEKDFMTTSALQAISDISLDDVEFVFCGGTCLSKAFHLTFRMSEDADFKVALAETGSISHVRSVMSNVKRQIVEAFRAAGFEFSEADFRARNNNQFIKFSLPYESAFRREAALRERLQVEFMVLSPQDEPVVRPVNTLANDLLGREEGAFPIACESVRETLAEKTVAMLRRLGEDRDRIRNDPHLIRHVYDIACIMARESVLDGDDELQRLFNEKVAYDGHSFAGHCGDFARDPRAAMQRALLELAENPLHRQHYERFVASLVFEENPPDFTEALASFSSIAGSLIAELPPNAETGLRLR